MSNRRKKTGRTLKGFVPSDLKLLDRAVVPLDLRHKAAQRKAMKITERRVRTMGDKLNLDLKINQGITELLKKIERHNDDVVRSISIDRSFIGRSVTVTTTPTRIIESTYARGYKILNPAASAGLTSTTTFIASTAFAAGASGDTQDSANNPGSVGPLGVASYKTLKLFLNISAISGATVTIDIYSQDPLSSNWVKVQSSVFNETTVATFYANLGTEGVDNNFAIGYNVSGGTATLSLSGILKDGLPGSSTGLNNQVYIGAGDSVNSTMGYPLLEGKEFTFFAAENTELWAVSELVGGLNLKIFELQ